ncbi:MAG: AAA family ATPase, partial [Phycisphaerae bacterium]
MAKETYETLMEQFAKSRVVMMRELGKGIIGQREVLDQIFAAVISRGHCLLVGVPGLAKTLMVSSIARVLELSFKRIQFTPDLMPSDITGTNVIEESEQGGRSFRFVKGPVFAHIILADEINRTPPKTQAAMLEAMQERQVTVGQDTMPLPDPFFVIATQNPIEQEGTYPLPE